LSNKKKGTGHYVNKHILSTYHGFKQIDCVILIPTGLRECEHIPLN